MAREIRKDSEEMISVLERNMVNNFFLNIWKSMTPAERPDTGNEDVLQVINEFTREAKDKHPRMYSTLAETARNYEQLNVNLGNTKVSGLMEESRGLWKSGDNRIVMKLMMTNIDRKDEALGIIDSIYKTSPEFRSLEYKDYSMFLDVVYSMVCILLVC